MSEINPIFNFAFESHNVRAQVDELGQPWFNANDVCAALELANPYDAVAKHVDTDDLAKREVIDSLGRTQRANHVNESGLYALIFGSTKEAAKRFKRWVTSEVLPTLRQTGRYELPGASTTPTMPASVLHRADHVVSATRCFNGLMRAAANLKLTPARAAASANQAAQRLTGVDILDELGVTPDELPNGPLRPNHTTTGTADDDFTQRVTEWLDAPDQASRDRFTSEEIAFGAFSITPQDAEWRSVVCRLGLLLGRLGWRKQRGGPGMGRAYSYRRPG